MGTIHLRRGDTVYVYSSHSYWDKEAKQHKTDRKLIGKLDPVTGEVVPTRKYVRKQASASDAPAEQANSVRAEGSTKTLISRITELEETKGFLNRVYEGSLSMMLHSMVSAKALSKKEIDELYEILKHAEEDTR